MRALLCFAATVLISMTAPAHACPLVDGLVDFNCDGEISILLTGDSLTYGIGDDRKLSDTEGGYPARIKEMFPKARVVKLAKPGATVESLRRLLMSDSWRRTLHSDFDYAILLIGVNNYWERTSVNGVLKGMGRIEHYLEQFGILVTVANFPPNARSFQRPYVQAVNRKIQRTYPDYIDFSTISPQTLNSDGLHPRARGYRMMAQIARDFIQGRLQEIAALYAPPTDE